MANFGFRGLAVVTPYAPTWREARSAVGAPEILLKASETANLGEAVARATLVVGTGTLTYRKPEQRVVLLPELAPLVRQELERGGRVAVVFGPEKHGLTRDDLSYCHILVEIPTDARQPSMNLGQAVAVCLYELAAGCGRAAGSGEVSGETHAGAKAHVDSAALSARLKSCPDTRQPFETRPTSLSATGKTLNSQPGAGPDKSEPDRRDAELTAAPSRRLELLAGVVEETMRAAGYSPRTMQEANRHDLRLLLRRLGLPERDLRRILGLFRHILWRLRHAPEGGRKAD
jgi:tRNA/rRNA methyltransferase